METLRAFVRTLGPVRLAILGGVGLALAGFFVWMIARVSQPPLALLFSELEMTEAAKITAQLDALRVPYQLTGGGTAVMVPGDQVARTRMVLAEQGLPSGGSIGYEIFDGTDALGTTNFQQNVNLVRALEGELSRTIRGIADVKTARVHLVLPQRELFSRDKPPASASVLLQMRGRNRLTPAQVGAVQQLIASAVPALAAGRISIVDDQGTLLSEANDGGDPLVGAAAKADQRRRALETHLARTIEQLVERTVGPGKVRAEVSAAMDFDRIDSSEEIFNPDGQVVRSTQTVDQSGSNRQGSASPVSVATNLPDASAAAASGEGETSSENRSEETVNYEISKKVVNHVREAGIVKQLSVAVLVDGTWVTDAQGAKTYQPRSADDLQQLTALVRGAVGYNAERGDRIDVVSMRFAETELPEPASTAILLGLEKADLIRLGEYLALLVLGVLALLVVVRPIVAKAIGTPRASANAPQTPLLAGGGAPPALTGPTGAGADPRDGDDGRPEEMIDLSRVEGRVKASSLKRVGEIVDKHPEESLAILRSWLHAEH
ncbi:MAG TPA: flagellar basal-body MS-ring/collar protein FliF [Rhodospirillales bacterium]|nr:flagellar basal-body MS-ring/collar protein FliF [Rhodospirillales bacterium]